MIHSKLHYSVLLYHVHQLTSQYIYTPATQDGHKPGQMIRAEELLERLLKTRYTFDELIVHPLPEGIDPLKLESYLDDEEFEVR